MLENELTSLFKKKKKKDKGKGKNYIILPDLHELYP